MTIPPIEDDPQNQIINPWIIVHQPGGNGEEMIYIFGGMEGATHKHFAIIIADLIQHLAHEHEVDVQEVLNDISEEMDNPTTTLITHKIQ